MKVFLFSDVNYNVNDVNVTVSYCKKPHYQNLCIHAIESMSRLGLLYSINPLKDKWNIYN